MTTDQSWKIIEGVHADSQGDMDRKCELLRERLSPLPEDDLRAFVAFFWECRNRAYHWDLWGAAYIIGGGCSDDSFSDFRSTLISHGRKVFEKALAEPDSLADLPDIEDDAQFEGYDYVVSDVESDRLTDNQVERSSPAEPSGEPWDEEDEEALAKRFPRLSERFF